MKPPSRPPRPGKRPLGRTVPTGGTPELPELPPPQSPDETLKDPIDLSDVAAISLPPEELEPDGDDLVLRWDHALDETDYFTLLHLQRPTHPDQASTDAQVKAAFQQFALAFHPDLHRGAQDVVREAAHRVYCRGAEAYRVLQDPVLRKRYARQLVAGNIRMNADEIAQSSRAVDTRRVERVEDIVKSAGAMPFAIRADELIMTGDLKQAKLQLQIAMVREPQNARLQEKIRELDEELALLRAAEIK